MALGHCPPLDQIGQVVQIAPMPPKRVVRETVSLYEAKTQLSRLVDRAAAGEEIVIAKSGRPRARLVPLEDTRPLRLPGKGRGRWRVGKDFDSPLPDDLLKGFEGGGR
jgi:prevent-host-death family protein